VPSAFCLELNLPASATFDTRRVPMSAQPALERVLVVVVSPSIWLLALDAWRETPA
jgi:hypothetical protein